MGLAEADVFRIIGVILLMLALRKGEVLQWRWDGGRRAKGAAGTRIWAV